MRQPLRIALACALLGSACSYDEGYFHRRIEELQQLANQGSTRARQQIEHKKTELLEAFKKLPAQDGRKPALDQLCRRARETIKEAEQILGGAAAEKQQEEKARIEEYKKPFVGRWQGTAMKLRISPAGMVNYERKTGAGNRTINAFLSEFQRHQFKVGFMGINTTFRIDRAPYQEGGKWKMKIDGVELTRVGDGSNFGTWLCTEIREESFCANPTTEFDTAVPTIHLLHVMPAPRGPQKFAILWIARDVGDAAPPNTKIAETPLSFDGRAAVGSTRYTIKGHLSRPTKGWPAGQYEVELRGDEKLLTAVKFTIGEAKPQQP